MERAYFDHAASSPLRPGIGATVVRALEVFGNASSVHREGQKARSLVEEARRQVAALVGVHAGQVIFTSGGTEANNLAVRGLAAKMAPGKRFLVSSLEHPCVRNTAGALGFTEVIPASKGGGLDMPWLEAELAKGDVGVVSVMMVNNETGAVQPVAAMARLAKAAGAFFHTDAVQAVGHIPVDFAALGVDAMTVSSHKLGGPKGAGALVVRPDVPMEALLTGGGQERNRRAGTEDVPAIAGFGAVCALIREHFEADFEHLMAIRRSVLDGVRGLGLEIIAEAAPKAPHILMVRKPGTQAEDFVMALDMRGVAASQGSACSSGRSEPSKVLLAMGFDDVAAGEGVRLSWGVSTTFADVEGLLGGLKSALGALSS